MTPLIQSFTKTLSPCGGCGSNGSVYETWLKAKQLGKKMKFQFAVVIEAETYKQAVAKVPDDFEILSGGVKPEVKPVPQGTQTSGQFSRTTAGVRPTPTLNG